MSKKKIPYVQSGADGDKDAREFWRGRLYEEAVAKDAPSHEEADDEMER